MNLQQKKFFFTVFCFAPVVRECFYLYTAFGCHYRETRKNDCVHCLSSCTFWSLGFLSGLSLYCNNFFIENSFCVVLSKPQRVKLLSKSKQQRHWNLPFSETISMVSLKQSNNIQALHHTLWRYIFTTDILTQLFFSYIF